MTFKRMVESLQFNVFQWASFVVQLGVVGWALNLMRGGSPTLRLEECGAAVYDYNFITTGLGVLAFGGIAMAATGYYYLNSKSWLPQVFVWLMGMVLILFGLLIPPLKTQISPAYTCEVRTTF